MIYFLRWRSLFALVSPVCIWPRRKAFQVAAALYHETRSTARAYLPIRTGVRRDMKHADIQARVATEEEAQIYNFYCLFLWINALIRSTVHFGWLLFWGLLLIFLWFPFPIEETSFPFRDSCCLIFLMEKDEGP